MAEHLVLMRLCVGSRRLSALSDASPSAVAFCGCAKNCHTKCHHQALGKRLLQSLHFPAFATGWPVLAPCIRSRKTTWKAGCNMGRTCTAAAYARLLECLLVRHVYTRRTAYKGHLPAICTCYRCGNENAE